MTLSPGDYINLLRVFLLSTISDFLLLLPAVSRQVTIVREPMTSKPSALVLGGSREFTAPEAEPSGSGLLSVCTSGPQLFKATVESR